MTAAALVERPLATADAVIAAHIPVRTCVACRTERGRADLLRIVRGPDRIVRLDLVGDLPGRGAYLCRDEACHRLALKRSSIERALHVSLPPAVRAQLEGLAWATPISEVGHGA